MTASGTVGSTGDVVTLNGSSAADTVDVNLQDTTFDNSTILLNNISSEIINGNNGNEVFSVTGAQPSYQGLTFNGGNGNSTLTVNDILPNNGVGTFFNAGTKQSDQNTLNVNAGQFYFAGDPAATSANLTVNTGNAPGLDSNGDPITNYGSVYFAAGALNSGFNQRNLAALNLGANTSAITAPPPSHADREVLIVGSLNMASGAILDLNANDMIISSGSLSTIQPLLRSGYANGNWNGSGIQSSAVLLDPTRLTTLGSLQNGGDVHLAKFDNVTSIPSAILIKYTYYGDADLSGVVDGSDYSRIDNGYLQSSTGWVNGDFNYDTLIDGSDYTLIDNAFNTQGSGL